MVVTVRNAIERLANEGSRHEDLLAWIGPSISYPHYEVSEEIAANFRDRFGHYPGAIQGPENRHIALGIVIAGAIAIGLLSVYYSFPFFIIILYLLVWSVIGFLLSTETTLKKKSVIAVSIQPELLGEGAAVAAKDQSLTRQAAGEEVVVLPPSEFGFEQGFGGKN